MKNRWKYLPLTVLFSFLSVNLPAQTQIEGGEVQGIWTHGGSPYHIMGELLVPDSAILTIEPGVDVIFMGHYRLEIEGRILAIGTKGLPITFTAMDTTVGWHGIRLVDIESANDTSRFVYCTFMHGIRQQEDPGGPAAGVLSIGYDNVEVRHCVFTRNSIHGTLFAAGGALGVLSASPVIEQNLFIDNLAGHGGAVVISAGAKPVFNNNIIAGNTAYGGGGVFVHESSPVMINNTIVDNHAMDHAGGIDCAYSAPTLINTIVYNNRADDHAQQIHLYANYNANFVNCALEGGRDAIAAGHVDNGCPSCSGEFQNIIEVDSSLDNLMQNSYQIPPWSPCSNAGVTETDIGTSTYLAPNVDYYNNPRPQPEGTMPDIGAVEQADTIIAVRDLSWVTALYIFPNPASGILFVRAEESGELSAARIEIYDSRGCLIWLDRTEVSDVMIHRMEIAQFTPGVYTIKITKPQRVYIGQFVVIQKVSCDPKGLRTTTTYISLPGHAFNLCGGMTLPSPLSCAKGTPSGKERGK